MSSTASYASYAGFVCFSPYDFLKALHTHSTAVTSKYIPTTHFNSALKASLHHSIFLNQLLPICQFPAHLVQDQRQETLNPAKTKTKT